MKTWFYLAGLVAVSGLAARASDLPSGPSDPLLDWSAWERHFGTIEHPCVTFKPADVARAKANISRHGWAKNHAARVESRRRNGRPRLVLKRPAACSKEDNLATKGPPGESGNGPTTSTISPGGTESPSDRNPRHGGLVSDCNSAAARRRAVPVRVGPDQPAWRFWRLRDALARGDHRHPAGHLGHARAVEQMIAGPAPVVEEALPIAKPTGKSCRRRKRRRASTRPLEKWLGGSTPFRAALATSLLGSSLEGRDAEALAGGDLSAIPDSTGTVPGGGVTPYQSQLEALFAECRDYVRKNVKRGACTKSDVWQTAETWALDKQRAVEQALIERIPRQPDLRERPGGK